MVVLLLLISDTHAFLAKTKKIDPSDYPFLLLAKDLQIYDIKLDLSGSSEKAHLKKWADGMYEIKYEYDLRDSKDFHPLFFSVKLEIDKNIAEAKKTYEQGLFVITNTSKAVGMACREIKDKVQWGDESYYAMREKKEQPVGLIFTTRSKNKVYTIIMAGLYSSDHSLILDLVIPKLQHLHNFTIQK